MFKKLFKKERQDAELVAEVQDLGVETVDLMHRRELGYAGLQERVRGARNIKYARLTWIIALISAIASVISATAAWFAVLKS